MDDSILERFKALFSGLERAHGEWKQDEDNLDKDKVKKGGKARTVAEPVTDEHWQNHIAGKVSLGIIPIRDDGTVLWACLDIDAYEQNVYRRAIDFVKEHSLPFVVCRSKSGGAHVFVFFSEPVKALSAQRKLTAMSKAMGHAGCEVFPKQIELEKDQYGNWLNLPYFDAEYSNKRVAYDDDGNQLSIEKFVELAESRRLSAEGWRLLEVPDTALPFEDGPPCLQALAQQKVGEGGRNNALLQFGVYAKLKYGEDYGDKVQTYNHTYFTTPLPFKEIQSTVLRSLERRDYGYKCEEQPMASVCNRDACLRRRYGIGGAGAEEFETRVGLTDMRRLIFMTPEGKPTPDDPRWQITVRGVVIEMSTDEIMNQRLFQKAVLNKISEWPQPIPQPRWHQIIQELLGSAEDVIIPFETSPTAQILSALQDYVKDNCTAKKMIELFSGQVMKTDIGYRFRLEDFLEYYRGRMRSNISGRDMAEHLKAINAERKESSPKNDQGRAIKLVYWEVYFSQLTIFENVVEEPKDDSSVEF